MIVIVISVMVILCCYSCLRSRGWPALSFVRTSAAIKAHYPLPTTHTM